MTLVMWHVMKSAYLELGSNLIYYFGTNDGLSFLWHMVHHECIYEA